jgi:tetratricopeptide (TPR) repeat protein
LIRHIVFAFALLTTIAAASAAARPTAQDVSATAPETPSARFADAARAVAAEYRKRGRHDDAIAVAEAGARVAKDVGDRRAEARLAVLIGQSYSSKRDQQAAGTWHARAKSLAESARDDETLSAAEDGLGLASYWTTLLSGSKDFAEARGHFARALELRRALALELGVAESLFHMGLTHEMSGDLAGANTRYEQSLAISERLKDGRLAASALRHVASVAEQRGDLETAVRNHERCLALVEADGHKLGVSAALAALADLYRRRGDLKAAGDAAARALAVGEEIADPIRIADALTVTGSVRLDAGDAAGAVPAYERAMEVSRAIGDEETITVLHRRLGAALHKSGRVKEGAEHIALARGRAVDAKMEAELREIDALRKELGLPER